MLIFGHLQGVHKIVTNFISNRIEEHNIRETKKCIFKRMYYTNFFNSTGFTMDLKLLSINSIGNL